MTRVTPGCVETLSSAAERIGGEGVERRRRRTPGSAAAHPRSPGTPRSLVRDIPAFACGGGAPARGDGGGVPERGWGDVCAVPT